MWLLEKFVSSSIITSIHIVFLSGAEEKNLMKVCLAVSPLSDTILALNHYQSTSMVIQTLFKSWKIKSYRNWWHQSSNLPTCCVEDVEDVVVHTACPFTRT